MAVRLPEGRVLDRDCLGQQPTWLLPAAVYSKSNTRVLIVSALTTELKHLVVIISRQVFSRCHQVQRLLVSSPPTSRWWGEAHNDGNRFQCNTGVLSICQFVCFRSVSINFHCTVIPHVPLLPGDRNQEEHLLPHFDPIIVHVLPLCRESGFIFQPRVRMKSTVKERLTGNQS